MDEISNIQVLKILYPTQFQGFASYLDVTRYISSLTCFYKIEQLTCKLLLTLLIIGCFTTIVWSFPISFEP
jgi:hypothetical protein